MQNYFEDLLQEGEEITKQDNFSKVDIYFDFDSVEYRSFSSQQVELKNDPISPNVSERDQAQFYDYNESFTPAVVVSPLSSPSKSIAKNKKKRIRKSCLIETKNITKFFGSRLYGYICEVLEQQKLCKHIKVDPYADLRLVKKLKCSTIKSLRQLWMQSQNLKVISEQYFRSEAPVIAAMGSERIDSAPVAIRFIASYIKGITDPDLFIKLKWNTKRQMQ